MAFEAHGILGRLLGFRVTRFVNENAKAQHVRLRVAVEQTLERRPLDAGQRLAVGSASALLAEPHQRLAGSAEFVQSCSCRWMRVPVLAVINADRSDSTF